MYLQRWLLWEKMWIKYVWMNVLFRIGSLSNYFFVTFTTSLISECNCFKKGSTCIRCDENGKCKCKKPYYTGDKCDKCMDGRHNPEENCPGKVWKNLLNLKNMESFLKQYSYPIILSRMQMQWKRSKERLQKQR